MNMPWKINDLPAVRVRHDPPTIDEALYAAEGLTDDVDHQVALAAALMGVSEEEVRKEVKPLGAAPRRVYDRFDRFEQNDRFERHNERHNERHHDRHNERHHERSHDQVFVSHRSGADRAVVVERKSGRAQMRLGPSLPAGVVRLNRIR
jgi:hypothetical protein